MEILKGQPSRLKSLLEKNPLEVNLLEELDELTLKFLHATVSEDDSEVKRRIIEASVEAYAAFPYPCIRKFHHIRLMMPEHPTYPQVLAAGKSGETLFAEIGCCMGSEVRNLAYDGYPAGNIVGIDIVSQFIDSGYTLFQDRDTTPMHFIADDVLKVSSTFEPLDPLASPLVLKQADSLEKLKGTLTHINIMRLFHLFDEATQYQIAKRLVVLLKRDKGAIIFGRQGGFAQAQKFEDPSQWNSNRWGHSPETWTALWKKVFTEAEDAAFAETRVKIWAVLEAASDLTSTDNYLVWTVEII